MNRNGEVVRHDSLLFLFLAKFSVQKFGSTGEFEAITFVSAAARLQGAAAPSSWASGTMHDEGIPGRWPSPHVGSRGEFGSLLMGEHLQSASQYPCPDRPRTYSGRMGRPVSTEYLNSTALPAPIEIIKNQGSTRLTRFRLSQRHQSRPQRDEMRSSRLRLQIPKHHAATTPSRLSRKRDALVPQLGRPSCAAIEAQHGSQDTIRARDSIGYRRPGFGCTSSASNRR